MRPFAPVFEGARYQTFEMTGMNLARRFAYRALGAGPRTAPLSMALWRRVRASRLDE